MLLYPSNTNLLGVEMKKLLSIICLLASINCMAETTWYSDGSFSQTTRDGYGGSTTYNSDGSWSQSQGYGKGS